MPRDLPFISCVLFLCVLGIMRIMIIYYLPLRVSDPPVGES